MYSIDIVKLIRMMERNASFGELGDTDFIFIDNELIVRNSICKYNTERLVLVSAGPNIHSLETIASYYYNKEILDEDYKVQPAAELGKDQELLNSYITAAAQYCSNVEFVIVQHMLIPELFELFKNEDPGILSDLHDGKLKFPTPTVITNGNIANINLTEEDEVISSSDLQYITSELADSLSNIDTSESIELKVSTDMATGDEVYWHKIKMSKVFVFDELHLLIVNENCCNAENYVNSYIAKIENPSSLADFLSDSFDHMNELCDKVSDNENFYELKIHKVKI